MKGSISIGVVEPYAQALMGIAQSQDLMDRFSDDVTLLIDTIDGSSEFRRFLADPLLSPEVKKTVLRQLTSDRVHPLMLNFLLLLIDRGRSLFLEAICKQFQTLVRQARQIVLASVISAIALNDDQKESVRQKVKQLTGARQVDLETQIDSDILGGVVIKVGSQVFDASLRGQLRRMGLKLSSPR